MTRETNAKAGGRQMRQKSVKNGENFQEKNEDKCDKGGQS